jgi:GWxTD domain-containing protein
MKSIFLFIISFFLSTNLYSNSIFFDVDFAVFRGEDNKNILELYYSVNQKFLEYKSTGSEFEASAKIDIFIYDKGKADTIFSKTYKVPSIVRDTSAEVFSQKLVGQLNYLLPNGEYKIIFIGSDFNNPGKIDRQEKEISIRDYNGTNISDIMLSTFINKSNDPNSIFYKNTLEVIPNPSSLFGMNLEELYYYYELYGLDAADITDDYKIRYSITRNENNNTIFRQEKKKKKTSEAIVDYGKLDVSQLLRGTYTFKIEIVNSDDNIKTAKTKQFYIYSEDQNETNLAFNEDVFLQSEFAIMTEDQLKNEFELSSYLRPDALKINFEGMSIDEKRKFIFNFWKLKDPNSLTPQNEFRTDYMKRVAEAKQLFRESFRDGWKTDRGRIYIIYGKPDDIERYPFESNTKSYEVWTYNTVEGGGVNVFVERQPSSGAYILIHSTFRNELRNDDWKSEIAH